MLGAGLGHTSLSLGGLGELGISDVHHHHHEHLHPHQPLPPHRPQSPPILPSHHTSSSTVDSSFSPGSTSHLPSSTVKIKPGEFSLQSRTEINFQLSLEKSHKGQVDPFKIFILFNS